MATTRESGTLFATVFGSIADVMTLGIQNYLDPDKAKQLKLLRSKHKVAAVIGDAAGFLVPGTPASLLGEGTSKLVGTFAGKAGEIVTRKMGKILGQAVEGALTQGSAGYAQGFITEGVHSTLEGKSFEEIISDAHNKGWDNAKGGLVAGGIGGAWTGFKGAGGAKTQNIDPNKIRYSQNSVNGSKEITESMKANGWKGDPINIVEMPDGNYTTVDNTRVAAARDVGMKVKANVRSASDPLPENMIDRFTTKKGVPKTWGEAVELRIGKQKASFRNSNPSGSYNLEIKK